MKCIHFADNACGVASRLANAIVIPLESQCQFCMSKCDPAMGVNQVTVSLAIVVAEPAKKLELIQSYKHLLKVVPVPGGPGTELKKLISWFYSPDDTSCKCNDRIAKMDKWGPDGCEERLDTIVRWLKHSAATHNTPFQETVVRVLIRRAINNARRSKG